MSLEGIVVGLLALVIGLGWAFYGLKVFTILLPIWAFFFGLTSGAQWSQDIFGQGFLSTVLSWGIGLVFGLVLAAISYLWYYAAVTIAGGALGYMLGVGFMDWLGIDAAILGIVVGLIVGAVFAAATFLLGVPAWLIIIFSGISGAAAAVSGVLIVFGQIKVEDLGSGVIRSLLTNTDFGPIGIIAWVVLAAVAIFWQLRDIGQTITTIERTNYRYN
jgi:Domain of unknown function (DUF4203)